MRPAPVDSTLVHRAPIRLALGCDTRRHQETPGDTRRHQETRGWMEGGRALEGAGECEITKWVARGQATAKREANSARVLCSMGRTVQDTASAHTMDATMHYHIHCSSLEANLDGMQISQRLEYPWTKWMHIVRHIGQVMEMMKMRVSCFFII